MAGGVVIRLLYRRELFRGPPPHACPHLARGGRALLPYLPEAFLQERAPVGNLWGGFSARGRTPLYRVKGSMQSDQYEEVLGDLVYHHIVADFGSPGGA